MFVEFWKLVALEKMSFETLDLKTTDLESSRNPKSSPWLASIASRTEYHFGNTYEIIVQEY